MSKKVISAEEACELLTYDPSTGELRWRARRPEMFTPTFTRTREHACANWNSIYAGTIAGTVDGLGRRQIAVYGRLYKAHRLIWLMVHGRWPDAQIDHVDGIRDNNELENLREATQSQNQQNRSYRSPRGLIGASIHKKTGRWLGRIRADGVTRNLGLFDTAEAAHAAYCREKERLHTFQPTPRPRSSDHDPRTAARHAR